jgi:hypothetical protein
MNNLPTPLIAAAVFALLFFLERFFPLRNTARSLVARLFVNLAISIFTFIQPPAWCNRRRDGLRADRLDSFMSSRCRRRLNSYSVLR